jgi:NCAIR mutase (PurE)-related protein
MPGMNGERIRKLLEGVRSGSLEIGAAEVELSRSLSRAEDLGFARVDIARGERCGFPEVIFCQGKSPRQAASIARRLFDRCGRVLATRADDAIRAALREEFSGSPFEECEAARAVLVGPPATRKCAGDVLVLSAGTCDIPVAEEAAFTARAMGSPVRTVYDVGVAGLHRLLGEHEAIRNANVLVVVAGMEGALASVVGGLVSRPVIAVPTSIGYGASFGGLAALLAMLNSCAAGVTVVNIDNGFGAGYAAALMNEARAPREERMP